MDQVVSRNIEILTRLEAELAGRITSEKVLGKVIGFLKDVERLMLKMVDAVPPGTVVPPAVASQGNMAVNFGENIQLLLEVVPEHKLTAKMQQLPQIFVDSLDKVVQYLGGDDGWLKDSCPSPDKLEVVFEGKLSLEKESDETVAHLETEKINKREVLGKNNIVPGDEQGDPGYPLAYHSIASQQEVRLILDTLFDLVFPKKSHLYAMKHCKAVTGKSLGWVSSQRLGPGEKGNGLLYKLVTDDLIERVCKDDRIFEAFGLSLNIVLFKVVIHTALYRLKKWPDKFPVIGGISFYIPFEEEMLRSAFILDTLIEMVVTPLGAKYIFHLKSTKERGGFISSLDTDEKLYRRIYQTLPNKSSAARGVTRYWKPKFLSCVVRFSGMTDEEKAKLFSMEQIANIDQFL